MDMMESNLKSGEKAQDIVLCSPIFKGATL